MIKSHSSILGSAIALIAFSAGAFAHQAFSHRAFAQPVSDVASLQTIHRGGGRAMQSPPPSPVLAQAIRPQARPQAAAQPGAAKAKVELQLSADRQVSQKDAQGKTQLVWQSLASGSANTKATVMPGDILRFNINGINRGNGPARNLVLAQPIPKGTVYVANSAKLLEATAEVQFSIDDGKTFSRQPMVKVRQPNGQMVDQPAPIESYTHLQLRVPQPLAPNATVRGEYQLKVR
jgi:uncharacterized repeat protein (TIGR01451 family)